LQHLPCKERIFWCPNCGTLKTEGDVPESECPRLVDRVRQFLTHLPGTVVVANRLGVTDSVGWRRLTDGTITRTPVTDDLADQVTEVLGVEHET